MGRQLFPLLGQAGEVALYILALALQAQFVGLGRDGGNHQYGYWFRWAYLFAEL